MATCKNKPAFLVESCLLTFGLVSVSEAALFCTKASFLQTRKTMSSSTGACKMRGRKEAGEVKICLKYLAVSTRKCMRSMRAERRRNFFIARHPLFWARAR